VHNVPRQGWRAASSKHYTEGQADRERKVLEEVACPFRDSLEIGSGLQVSAPVDSAVSTRAEDDPCISYRRVLFS